jgi:uncharacterized membrane protein
VSFDNSVVVFSVRWLLGVLFLVRLYVEVSEQNDEDRGVEDETRRDNPEKIN